MIILLVVPILNVVNVVEPLNVSVKKDSTVIRLLVADLNVLLTPTASFKKPAETTSVKILAMELVVSVHFVKSLTIILSVTAHQTTLGMPWFRVMKSELHRLFLSIHATHLLVAQTVDVLCLEITPYAHAYPDSKAPHHFVNRNASSAVNVPSTKLVSVKSVSIHVLELVVPMQTVKFSTTIQSVAVLKDSEAIPSSRVNTMKMKSLMIVKLIEILAFHLLVDHIQSVKSNKTDQSALALKTLLENLHTVDQNVS